MFVKGNFKEQIASINALKGTDGIVAFDDGRQQKMSWNMIKQIAVLVSDRSDSTIDN
jgi:hypothetical protein